MARDSRLDGLLVFGRGFALWSAWVVAKEPFELLDLMLLRLPEGIAHDFVLILITACADLVFDEERRSSTVKLTLSVCVFMPIVCDGWLYIAILAISDPPFRWATVVC